MTTHSEHIHTTKAVQECTGEHCGRSSYNTLVHSPMHIHAMLHYYMRECVLRCEKEHNNAYAQLPYSDKFIIFTFIVEWPGTAKIKHCNFFFKV